MAEFVLILGGARSGKSRFAGDLARQIGGEQVLFIATAEACDEEMARRIEVHRESRPAKWDLLEAPVNVAEALGTKAGPYGAILLDCVTLLVSNVLTGLDERSHDQQIQSAVIDEVESLLAALRRHSAPAILVSGEVGSGLIPNNRLGRVYRDLLGWTNQSLAATLSRPSQTSGAENEL